MVEDPELRELHELMESVNKSALENKLPTWKPTEKQWEFLNDTAHRKALVASNQCLSCDTILEDAETGERFRVGDGKESFVTWAWNGKERVKAQAVISPVGRHEVWKLEEGVEAAGHHKILTCYGWAYVADDTGVTAPILRRGDDLRTIDLALSMLHTYMRYPELASGELTNDVLPAVMKLHMQFGEAHCAEQALDLPSTQSLFEIYQELDLSNADIDLLRSCILPFVINAQAYIPAGFIPRSAPVLAGVKECFEIEVPGLGNYFVGDILHHNCGKSQTTMYELALHLTGLYPPNWKGIRFDHAIEAWHIGVDIAKNIGTIQKSLLGDIGEWGTGYIPKKCLMFKGEDLVCVKKPMIASAIWKIKVKHVSGGWSNLEFMANTQDRKTFQSNTIDLIVFDEEPPDDVHSECVIRILVKKGYILYAFTPLEKEYHVWDTLAEDPDAKIHVITMYDCPWHDEKSIATVRATCHTESEAQARIYGIPNRSSGRIFDFDPCEYSCNSFELPAHWPRLGGIDIGYNHPTGCVALAWDRDQNIVYVYQEFKERGKSAVEISKTIRHWGVVFACSHDAFNHNMATTDTVADVFKSEGIHVFSAGKDPWARIERVRSLISEGRLYIFKDRCPLLMQEMASYRTKDVAGGGVKIFKQGEDVVDAFTHAVASYEKAGIRKGLRSQPVQIKQWEPKDKRYGI